MGSKWPFIKTEGPNNDLLWLLVVGSVGIYQGELHEVRVAVSFPTYFQVC